jgi:peptide/nickel transport system permease protein
MRLLRDLWRICWADKPALFGGFVILVYVFFALFGPLLTQIKPGVGNPLDAYLAPSWHHPLGTDNLGNDILSEIILGTRPILVVGVAAAVMTVFIGVVVGLVSGYFGGRFDAVSMRVVDVFLTIPGLPLIIVLASILRVTNPLVLAAVLSITAWAGLARVIRSQALSLRTADFVDAAKISGLPLRNIISRQLLPNVGPYVAISFMLAITGAIYAEIGLFVLGVAPVSGSNWGVMINLALSQGALYTTKSLSYLFSPMVAIVILQVAFIFFTRALDSIFNPRLRVQ